MGASAPAPTGFQEQVGAGNSRRGKSSVDRINKKVLAAASAAVLILGIPISLNTGVLLLFLAVIAAGLFLLWHASRYWFERVAKLLVVLFAVTLLTFLAMRAFPEKPEVLKAGPGATPEQLAIIREQLGLDRPLPTQYWIWVQDTFTGNLGVSYGFNTPVTDLIRARLPPTLVLMFYAQFFALALAIPVGIWAAYRQNGPFDRATNTFAFGLLSTPNFILGVLFVFIFALRLGWFPAISSTTSLFESPVGHFKSYFLPALVLALASFAGYMRLLRTDMIATLQNDFISMARAKGMSTGRILLRHALRPSSFSLITAAALQVGALIGGALIVEQIFALPGMGTLTIEAIGRRDYPVVQVCVTFFAVAFVLLNFAVDALYSALDPRIRHARALL